MKVKNEVREKVIYTTAVEILLVGCLTGICAGVFVSLYNILASLGEEFSRGVYAVLREKPAYIPLLFVVLFVCAVIIGTVVKALPMIRGSGIPQTEGASRGVLRFKWYQVLCGMFAASLVTIFLGLSAGSEGPSLEIGGACGNGVATLTKRNPMLRRYQITGGASAGLAIAFNAPLTGMAFAFEEAQKRFSAEVFICAFSSVVSGLVTRNLIRSALGLPVGSTFTTFAFPATMNMASYGYVVLAALVCAALGVAFYYIMFATKKLFAKITFWKGTGKMLIPFLLGGTFSLLSVYAMGGGHEFIQSLGSLNEEPFEYVFRLGLAGSLVVIVLMKFIASVLNMSAGVPCGVFIPMLAIGAGIGAIMSRVCVSLGMDAAYADLLIMICMATFFATIVKAPLTAIVMVFELTWNFSSLIPVTLGVAIGYMVGTLLKTEPIYEKLLESNVEDYRKDHPVRQEKFFLAVGHGSLVDGAALREISWPGNVNVVSVLHGETEYFTTGATVLYGGDRVKIETLTDDKEESLKDIEALLKPGKTKKA